MTAIVCKNQNLTQHSTSKILFPAQLAIIENFWRDKTLNGTDVTIIKINILVREISLSTVKDQLV